MIEAGGRVLTLGWPTVCGFVSCIRWVAPLSHSGFRLGFPNFEFETWGQTGRFPIFWQLEDP